MVVLGTSQTSAGVSSILSICPNKATTTTMKKERKGAVVTYIVKTNDFARKVKTNEAEVSVLKPKSVFY